jgi:two-component system CheB/CheR fusion protein
MAGSGGKPADREKEPRKKKTAPASTQSRKPERRNQSPMAASPSFVVGIGSSAGGLEALTQFFDAMPGGSGLAFVVVSHLEARQKSMLAELLGRHTAMAVKEAEDGEPLLGDHIYIIPPGKDLHLYNDAFQLLHPSSAKGVHTPIDIFFQSLAADRKERAIGIILSGMGSDGSLGVRAIKGELGMIMVQEPGSAQSAGMPERAIQTGLADFVLPPARMPEQLLNYISNSEGKRKIPQPPLPADEQAILHKVFFLLRKGTGHDFSGYKASTVLRRIRRRQIVHAIATGEEYLRFLEANPREVRVLFKELLIGVTSFFRDPEAFALLKEKGVKPLLADKAAGDQVRVWVVGCASGEEAYSVAIILRECLAELHREVKTQIFATDIDAEAIALARTGRYPQGIAADLSEERLNRFFVRDSSNLLVRKEVREMVVFAEQNALRDPPFTKLDLVCCRNLLIYLEPELQKKLLSLLHFSLLPAGLLFLGSSEALGMVKDGFAEVSSKWKLFRKKKWAAMLPEMFIPSRRRQVKFHDQTGKAAAMQKERDRHDLGASINEVLLGFCAPPAVVINRQGEVLYIHGRTGKYLEPTAGRANWNIFKMAREGLELELPTAVRLAVSKGQEVMRRNLRVRTNGEHQEINLRVHPLAKPEELAGLLLVMFEELQPAPAPAAEQKGDTIPAQEAREVIRELEQELARSQENLQTVSEELESADEELQSTNEEYQSANEELQSTNEELESSREELQSVNEELVTLNSELQAKVEEAARGYEDMKTFLDNLEIPTIFLDSELRVKRFSAWANRIVRLIDSDIGRPLADLLSHLRQIDLVAEAERVIRTLRHQEKEVQTTDGHWYLMRILPYRKTKNAIEGAVLLFIDIDALKKTFLELTAVREARAYAEDIINTVREPLLVLTSDLVVQSANASFYREFRVREEETVGRRLYQLGEGQWDIPRLRELVENILPRKEFFDDFLVEHDFSQIGKRRMLLNGRRIRRSGAGVDLILLAIEDVTGKLPDVRAEQ